VSVKLKHPSTILVYKESKMGTKMGVNVNVKGKEVKEKPDVKVEFRTKVRDGEKYEIARVMERFGGSPYTEMIKGRCHRGAVKDLLKRLDEFSFRVTESTNTIYISGSDSKVVMRYVAILVGCMHCTKNPYKYEDLIYAVENLGSCEVLLWFTRMAEMYELKGYQGICRVAKAFKILYRVD
jgi:hypothetical protein